MKSTQEKKYIPEIPQKEIDELRNSAKAMSDKVIAENIARMKKTSVNRPEANKLSCRCRPSYTFPHPYLYEERQTTCL